MRTAKAMTGEFELNYTESPDIKLCSQCVNGIVTRENNSA